MANELVAGALAVEVYAKRDKLNADLRKAEEDVKKGKERIERNYANIKTTMDDRILKLKLNDVEKLHARLKQRLEEKVKLNYDVKSIEVTRQQLNSVENALRGIQRESDNVKKSSLINESYRNLQGMAGSIGLAVGLSEIVQISAESIKLAARVEGVREAFNKLNQPNLLSELKKLTKNTISDFELMRNVLIGIDLGATNEQLKIFAEFARFDSVRKGNSTLQTFNNILSGVLRGSTELLDNFGISITELNGEIEILAAEKLNKTGTELSAVERRILSVDAATNIMNRRLSETGEIALKSSEKIDRMAARAENLKVKLGNALIEINDKATDVAETWLNSIGGLYKVLISLIIDIDEAKIEEEVKKAKQTTQKVIGKKWQILADGTKIQVLPGGEELFNAINSSFGQIEERIKQLKEKRLTLKPSDIIDVRNIDAEISKLEKFINPEKNIIQKKEKVQAEFSEFDAIKEDHAWFEEQLQLENELAQIKQENLQVYIDARNELTEDEKREFDERVKREEEIHNLQMNSISEFGNALEGLGSHGKTFVSYFNVALQSALRIADAINTLKTDQLSGILGIATGGFGFLAKFIPGLAKGGTVSNYGGGNVQIEPYKKFSSGVSNFSVPAGFNHDNYLIGVQSGERVSVTPASGSGSQSTDKILTDVYNRIGALTEVIRTQSRSANNNTIVLKIGEKTIGTVIQEINNRLNRQNTFQTTDF